MTGPPARTAFFVLLPAIGVGGVLGLPVLICLAGALSLRPSLLRQAVENSPPWPLLLATFFALAAASAAWSQHEAGTQSLKVVAIAAFAGMFAAAAADDARLTRAATVAIFFMLAFLLAIEAIWGLPLNRAAQPGVHPDELGRNVSRAGSLLLALTWSAAATLAARSGLAWQFAAVAVLGAGGVISMQFGQFSNTVGFVAGLIAFGAGFVAPRWTLSGVALALLLWLAAAPFATPALVSALHAETLPFSWNERLQIWQYVIDRIWDRPFFGHGLDAGRAHMPAVSVHPHSASLQIWFDLGVAGALVAAAAITASAWALIKGVGENRHAAAAAAGTIVSLGVVANLSFNFWAEWWLATMFLAAACVGALARSAAK